jgi:hypothetical protein
VITNRAKLIIITFFILLAGCYSGIHGKVVDEITGDPIEGAVVLVEWTKTYGLGLSYTKPHTVFEGLTNKDGMIFISSPFDPFLNPPRITIYKKGYVAWNNLYVFPDWAKREDFVRDDFSIKLQRFTNNMSHKQHVYFLNTLTHYGKMMSLAYKWEELEKAQ